MTSFSAPIHAYDASVVSSGGIEPSATAASSRSLISAANRSCKRISDSSKAGPSPTPLASSTFASLAWLENVFECGFDCGAGLVRATGVAGDGRIGIGQQSIRESIHQRKKDLPFAGEMEIDTALGATGGVGDVIDARAMVAGLREDLRRRLKNPLPRRSLATI